MCGQCVQQYKYNINMWFIVSLLALHREQILGSHHPLLMPLPHVKSLLLMAEQRLILILSGDFNFQIGLYHHCFSIHAYSSIRV
jgi:hypothetical protein